MGASVYQDSSYRLAAFDASPAIIVSGFDKALFSTVHQATPV
jgi:hypothetical protein